ncbi:MAG: hypothetical protein QXX79_06865 [Candidatus Bathyarchaeia archaeon]
MQKIYKISLLTIIGLVALYTFQGYYQDFMHFFSNAFPPIIAGAAVIMSGFSLKRYWRKSKGQFPLVWLYFAIGLLLWFLGEVFWALYTLVLGVELPYPSIADAFWVAGYIPFFIALYWYVKLFSRALTKKMLALSMAATTALTIIVADTLFTYNFMTEENLAALIMDFAYPILDLLLFSVAHIGLTIFWKGKLGKSWLLISAATVTDTCADALFSYTTAQGAYYSGHMLDVLFCIAYLFYLMAFYIHTKEF